MFVVPPAAWSLKREVIWIPIVGWAVRTFNPIAINRSAGHSAVNQVISQGRERLAAGMGIIVYPEGTRVLPGQTRKYGISGALLATETGLDAREINARAQEWIEAKIAEIVAGPGGKHI
jgi:1-acyl-sn-glycerol-3-phosphate acyltransferase